MSNEYSHKSKQNKQAINELFMYYFCIYIY